MSLQLREHPPLQQQCMMLAYEFSDQETDGVRSGWSTFPRHQVGLLFLSFDVTGAFRFGLELVAQEVADVQYSELVVHRTMPVLHDSRWKIYVDVACRKDGVFIPVSEPYNIELHGDNDVHEEKFVKIGGMQIEYLDPKRSAWSPMSLDEAAEREIDCPKIYWGDSPIRQRIASHIASLQNMSKVSRCRFPDESENTPQLKELCAVEIETIPILIEIMDKASDEMRYVISELVNSSLSKSTAKAKKGNQSCKEAVTWFVSQVHIILCVLAADPAMLNYHFGEMTHDMRRIVLGADPSNPQEDSNRSICQSPSMRHLVARRTESGAWLPGAIFYVLHKITSPGELKLLHALCKRYEKEIVVGGAFAAVVAINNLSLNTVKWLVDHVFEQKIFSAVDWVAYLNNTVLSSGKLPTALIQFLQLSSADSFAVLIKNVNDTYIISILAKHYFTDATTGAVDVKCRSLNNVLKSIEGIRAQQLLREMLQLKCYSLSCIMRQLADNKHDQVVEDFIYEQVLQEVLGKFSSAENEAVAEQKYRKFLTTSASSDAKVMLTQIRNLLHNYNHPQLNLNLSRLQSSLQGSIAPMTNFFEKVAVGVHYAKGDRTHYAEADKLVSCCDNLAAENHYYLREWRYKLLQLFTELNEQAGGTLTTNDDDKLSLARRVYLALQEIDKLIDQQAVVLYRAPKPDTIAAPQLAASSSGSSPLVRHENNDDDNQNSNTW